MRDDLISRKETERILRLYADDVGCNRGEYELANGILKAVSRIIDPESVPTSYDVSKVIEKLKIKEEDAIKSIIEHGKTEFHLIKIMDLKELFEAYTQEQIEIVKFGGVTDD